MALTAEIIYKPGPAPDCRRPLFFVPVSAGFPSPADDYIENCLDLNKHLIKHPAATFFVRVKGDSMIEAGIHSGDILIVDRSLEATDKKVVIAVIDGELMVKRIKIVGEVIYLLPENHAYSPTEITESMNFAIWGVVTNVIHAL
ncbi:MAG TPA: translesion error-prone DNA polymerase V autoproteolytic subunit [Desulfarculaceae bacterium]|nr:translesion error-prone DNA polymerase V autoproteolytic subunit [Desulfarculaceae bacterium]